MRRAGRTDGLAEIMVRRLTVEEAMARVDGFLDRSFREGRGRVRVIHGKGTGTLRKAVQDQLARHPLVAGFALAEAWQGGLGATMVELHPIHADSY